MKRHHYFRALLVGLVVLIPLCAFAPVPFPPPTLSLERSASANGVKVTIYSIPYVLFDVEATTNLAAPASWQVIATVLTDGPSGSVSLTDVAALELYPQRFYRARRNFGF